MIFTPIAQGVHFPPIENVVEWPAMFFDGTPYAFNKIALIALISLVVPAVIFKLAGSGSAEKPSKIRVLAESIIGFIEEQVAKPGIGAEYKPYVPLLTTMFMFIAVGNLFGVIPFFHMSGNARMAGPLFLALVAWAAFIGAGIKHNGLGYFKEVVWPSSVANPGMRGFLGFIEFFSVFIARPMSHAIRLFANMLAGHILLITFGVLTIASFAGIGASLSGVFSGFAFLGAFAGLLAFTAFEMGVSFIQAFVFSILAAVYIGSSVNQH